MTDKQIIKFVTGFRKELLGKKSSLGMCWKICFPLAPMLNGIDVPCKITEGYFCLSEYNNNKGIKIDHFWITLSDGRIIDPTADQFNGMREEVMPIVYLGELPEYYKPKKIRK